MDKLFDNPVQFLLVKLFDVDVRSGGRAAVSEIVWLTVRR